MSIYRNLLLFAVLMLCFNLSLSLSHEVKKPTPAPSQTPRHHSHTHQMVQIVSNKHVKREKKNKEDQEQSQFTRKGKAQQVLQADLHSNFIELQGRNTIQSTIRRHSPKNKKYILRAAR